MSQGNQNNQNNDALRTPGYVDRVISNPNANIQTGRVPQIPSLPMQPFLNALQALDGEMSDYIRENIMEDGNLAAIMDANRSNRPDAAAEIIRRYINIAEVTEAAALLTESRNAAMEQEQMGREDALARFVRIDEDSMNFGQFILSRLRDMTPQERIHFLQSAYSGANNARYRILINRGILEETPTINDLLNAILSASMATIIKAKNLTIEQADRIQSALVVIITGYYSLPESVQTFLKNLPFFGSIFAILDIMPQGAQRGVPGIVGFLTGLDRVLPEGSRPTDILRREMLSAALRCREAGQCILNSSQLSNFFQGTFEILSGNLLPHTPSSSEAAYSQGSSLPSDTDYSQNSTGDDEDDGFNHNLLQDLRRGNNVTNNSLSTRGSVNSRATSQLSQRAANIATRNPRHQANSVNSNNSAASVAVSVTLSNQRAVIDAATLIAENQLAGSNSSQDAIVSALNSIVSLPNEAILARASEISIATDPAIVIGRENIETFNEPGSQSDAGSTASSEIGIFEWFSVRCSRAMFWIGNQLNIVPDFDYLAPQIPPPIPAQFPPQNNIPENENMALAPPQDIIMEPAAADAAIAVPDIQMDEQDDQVLQQGIKRKAEEIASDIESDIENGGARKRKSRHHKKSKATKKRKGRKGQKGGRKTKKGKKHYKTLKRYRKKC